MATFGGSARDASIAVTPAETILRGAISAAAGRPVPAVHTADVLVGELNRCGAAPRVTSPRGRQNVVFELGYFIGALGRSRVIILYEEGVEFPSDLHGIIYVPLDREGAWRTRVAREFRTIGLPVDPDVLFE
jgi:hypothetical protein